MLWAVLSCVLGWSQGDKIINVEAETESPTENPTETETVLFVASTSYDVTVPYSSGLYEYEGGRSGPCQCETVDSVWCSCLVPQRVPYLTAGRGYNLIKMMSIEGHLQITFAQSYDLFANKENAVLLATELNRCNADTMVILFSHDDASANRLHPQLQLAMTRCKTNSLLTNPDIQFELRSSYVFLGTCADQQDLHDMDMDMDMDMDGITHEAAAAAAAAADQHKIEVYHPHNQVMVQFTVKEGQFHFIDAGEGQQWFRLPQVGDELVPWTHQCLRAGHTLLVAISHYGMIHVVVVCRRSCLYDNHNYIEPYCISTPMSTYMITVVELCLHINDVFQVWET